LIMDVNCVRLGENTQKTSLMLDVN
jgi:hypothetical protein